MLETTTDGSERRFTLDGYQDLDGVAASLDRQGFTGHPVVVAAIARELLAWCSEEGSSVSAAWELWCACRGIVQAAEEDGLL